MLPPQPFISTFNLNSKMMNMKEIYVLSFMFKTIRYNNTIIYKSKHLYRKFGNNNYNFSFCKWMRLAQLSETGGSITRYGNLTNNHLKMCLLESNGKSQPPFVLVFILNYCARFDISYIWMRKQWTYWFSINNNVGIIK